MVNEEQIVRDCLAWNLVIYSSRLMGYMRLSVIVTISLYEQLLLNFMQPISCNKEIAVAIAPYTQSFTLLRHCGALMFC